MITVNGIQLDFDITSPTDMLRYKEAGERAEEAEDSIPLPTMSSDDPAFLDAYIEMLNAELRAFGNYIDEIFGDGIAEQLLGSNPSLNKVIEINDAISDAVGMQGKEFGVKLQKYKPNRAARRARR